MDIPGVGGGRPRTAESYLLELEGICRQFGVVLDDTPWLPHEGSRHLALVDARVTAPAWPGGVLRVMEDLDMHLGDDPRTQYIYHYVRHGASIFGYHRQPGERWRDHRHDYAIGGIVSTTSTLREVLAELDVLESGVARPGFPRPPGLP